MPKCERVGKTLLTCGNVRHYIRGFQEWKGRGRRGGEWFFTETFGRLCRMDKQEHGRRLKGAMSLRGLGRDAVADAANVSARTVTNWTSGATMPSELERALMRQLLGNYDSEGDPVEAAVRASRLTEDRQYAVLGTYKRQLREQDDEAERRGSA